MFEVPSLKALLQRIQVGEVDLVEVESEHPSPFASSLMFDYVASYLYEGDAPAAERRAQALSLDRALLAELLAADDLRELLDPEAIDEIEEQLRGKETRRAATTPSTGCAGWATSTRPSCPPRELLAARRAVRVRIARPRPAGRRRGRGALPRRRRDRAAARPAGLAAGSGAGCARAPGVAAGAGQRARSPRRGCASGWASTCCRRCAS